MDRSSSMAMFFLFLFSVVHPISSIDDKCAACRAVAVELETGLANEKPRNHLDMRHRLDSRGQREGKLIDYKVSELRVVELLDGLCDRMKDYTLNKTDSGKAKWIKVEDWNSAVLNIDKQEADAYAKDMSTFCGRLLEQTEEELAEKIKSGTVSVGDAEEVLCRDLSRHCRPAKYRDLAESKGSEDESTDDAEL
eukprot:Gb_26038 [translate_table: standard]